MDTQEKLTPAQESLLSELDRDHSAQAANALQSLLDAMLKASLQHTIDRRIEAIALKSILGRKTLKITINDIPQTPVTGPYHYQLPTLIHALKVTKRVQLIGPAGAGKTHASKQAADALGVPFYHVSCYRLMTDYNLVGYQTADGTYIPGPVREPFEKGGVLLLDEIDRGSHVLLLLNSILENNLGRFPDAQITGHPDFYVIASANTLYGQDAQYTGAEQVDAALFNRFTAKILWDYDPVIESYFSIDAPGWDIFVQDIRTACARLGVQALITPRHVRDGAKLLASGMKRPDVENLLLASIMPDAATWRKVKSEGNKIAKEREETANAGTTV